MTRKPSQAAATPTATPITVSARRSIGCCQGCCGLTAEATKTTAVVIAAVAASPGRPIRYTTSTLSPMSTGKAPVRNGRKAR